MSEQLTYDLTDNGIEYRSNGHKIKITGKSSAQARIAILCGNRFLPTETGNLGSSTFRANLVAKAGERFESVEGLAEALDLISISLDEHLKATKSAEEEDAGETTPNLKGTPYRIHNGGFARIRDKVGELPMQLTNFVARVEEEVIRDDGAEAKRHYMITGEAGNKKLPKAEVPASTFPTMNWIADAWGLDALVTAGPYGKDYTREAIERMSQGAVKRHTYQHLGWRTLPDGTRAYLSGNGAVDTLGVEVELDGKLRQYQLPLDASEEEITAGVKAAVELMYVVPADISTPLLGAMYLAPLSEVITPDFVLWVWGPTGSLKSTLTSLALNHFGDFTEQSLPLSFESTANCLERELFLVKDTPTVVDDWRPTISRGDEADMAKKAQRLLRGVGNQQGRGRMNSDSSLRDSYPPRGVVVVTAEGLPEGPAFESAISRSLAVRLDREWVDLKLLTELQKNRRALGAAMLGFVRWLPHDEEDVREKFEIAREKYREALPGSHPRLPSTLAALDAGFGAFLRYAVARGVFKRNAAVGMYEGAFENFLEAGKTHMAATRGGDPASQFIRLFGSLLDARRVHFRDKGSGQCPGFGDNAALREGKPEKKPQYGYHTEDGPNSDVWGPLGWESSYGGWQPIGKFAGWVDDDFFYLDKDGAYAAVQEYARRGDIPFGVKPRHLWESLAKAGISLTNSDRVDTVVKVAGKSRRAVQIPRVTFETEV